MLFSFLFLSPLFFFLRQGFSLCSRVHTVQAGLELQKSQLQGLKVCAKFSQGFYQARILSCILAEEDSLHVAGHFCHHLLYLVIFVHRLTRWSLRS